MDALDRQAHKIMDELCIEGNKNGESPRYRILLARLRKLKSLDRKQ